MKKLLLLMSLFCLPLLAFVAEDLPQDTLRYTNYVIDGKSFKILCSNGLIIDACRCGCPKDATDILDTWSANAALEISPYVHDAEGSLFVLRNLDNDTEIFTWLRDDSAHARLPKIVQNYDSMSLIQLSDDSHWLFTEQTKPDWKVGDRIIISSHHELFEGMYWLINLDQPDQPARESIFWQFASLKKAVNNILWNQP